MLQYMLLFCLGFSWVTAMQMIWVNPSLSRCIGHHCHIMPSDIMCPSSMEQVVTCESASLDSHYYVEVWDLQNNATVNIVLRDTSPDILGLALVCILIAVGFIIYSCMAIRIIEKCDTPV